MRSLFLFSILFVSLFANAQNNLPTRQIQLFAGQSFNGTGDMKGFAYNTEFGQYFTKRSAWYLSIGGSIHDTEDPIFYTLRTGEQIDGSLRSTIAGFQVSGLYGYSFIRSKKNELLLKAGALLRYQSSSYPDQYGVYYPPSSSGYDPFVNFYHTSPQRTFAVGGSLALAYNYTMSNKISIGMLANFQTDTNGDAISQLLFSIGRRF
jgi:hypothetical protein